MKPLQENPNTVATNGIKSSVKFGIKADGLHHVLGILRDQLYSNKEQAVIREYSTNAVDAHVEAGIGDRPIEVTIPNPLNLNFKVRDFGPSLSDEEIHNVYAFYGESSKRNTNEQTGMLGIGSKSAFAYGDNFVINSYIDGTKHIYNAYIDPTQVGQISKLGTEPTSEENGLEIVVPVKREDVDTFREEAYSLFEHFKVMPIIKGVEAFEYEAREVLFEGDDWKWNKREDSRWGTGNPIAVMGNIGYPFDLRDLNLNSEVRDDLEDLVTRNLVLNFNIGDLEISASREKLQFTEYTRKNITQRLVKVSQEIGQEVQKQFAACDSKFAAHCLYGEIFDYASGLYSLRNVLKPMLKWNGKDVHGSEISFPRLDGEVDLKRLRKPHRGFKMRLEEDWKIDCDSKTVVVVNDLGWTTRGLLGRLLPLAIDENKKVYLVTFQDDAARKAFAKEDFDAPMIPASTLEKKAISDYYPTSGVSSSSGSKRIVGKVFKLKADVEWARRDSDYWEAVDVDLENESGVYVLMDRFKVEHGGGRFDASVVAGLAHKWKKAFGENDPMPEIYAVRLKDAELMDSNANWTSLVDYFSVKAAQKLERDNLLEKIANQAVDGLVENVISLRRNDVMEIAESVQDKNSDFVKFAKDWASLRMDSDTLARVDDLEYIFNALRIADLFREKFGLVDAKLDNSLVETAKRFNTKYPMLDLIDSWGLYRSPEKRPVIGEYVSQVDLTSAESIF